MGISNKCCEGFIGLYLTKSLRYHLGPCVSKVVFSHYWCKVIILTELKLWCQCKLVKLVTGASNRGFRVGLKVQSGPQNTLRRGWLQSQALPMTYLHNKGNIPCPRASSFPIIHYTDDTKPKPQPHSNLYRTHSLVQFPNHVFIMHLNYNTLRMF